MTRCDTGKNKERSDMNGKQKVEDITQEENTMTEEKEVDEVPEATELEDLCPIDQQPWDESACAVIEQRVAEKVMKRLKAEQSLEEAVAPDEDEVPVGEDYQHPEETIDEPVIATEPEPKED